MAVAYALIVDGADAWLDRAKLMRMLNDDLLAPLVISRETWGTGPQAERGARAMMGVAPQPAAPVDWSKRRREAGR